MAVTVVVDESQRRDLIAHDIPIAFISRHVETLEEAITANDDRNLVRIAEASNYYGPDTIFNLIRQFSID